MDLEEKIKALKQWAKTVSEMGRWARKRHSVHDRLLCEARWRKVFVENALSGSN